MKASIHVTRAHLTHGTPGSPDDCAIARAIQDSFQDVCNPWVCYDVVYFMDLEGRCYEGVLPTRECEWVRLLFDRNILPGPKTFQLEYRRITRKTYDRPKDRLQDHQCASCRPVDKAPSFLGYHFERGMKWPRRKSLDKLKDTIRGKTRRTDARSMQRICEDLNRTLRGWFEYFKHSKENVFGPIDAYTRGRLRSILRKRIGKKGRGRGTDHQRWPNAYFSTVGLFSLK